MRVIFNNQNRNLGEIIIIHRSLSPAAFLNFFTADFKPMNGASDQTVMANRLSPVVSMSDLYSCYQVHFALSKYVTPSSGTYIP